MANANWYQGIGTQRQASVPVTLPPSLLDRHADPAGYLADPGLVDAVNVALHLGQPLLLTGQPGTGKTQLATSLAWELGLDPLLKFEAKSTSVSRDLFYTYDTIGRFHAAQAGQGAADSLDYIRFNALGLAILRANDPADVAQLLPNGHEHRAKRRSVVLIDEIDKAPRDFPNDLLNEVEGMYFKIPELGNATVTSSREFRPILVLTSNSEKNLSEAFLRRCVFYDIPFPDRERLTRIVHSRLGEAITDKRAVLDAALDLFDRLRDPASGLHKRPSTGELLAWLQILAARSQGNDGYIRSDAMIDPALATLVKTADDRPKARELLKEWLKTKQA
jgi:MoxR-like ATPase